MGKKQALKKSHKSFNHINLKHELEELTYPEFTPEKPANKCLLSENITSNCTKTKCVWFNEEDYQEQVFLECKRLVDLVDFGVLIDFGVSSGWKFEKFNFSNPKEFVQEIILNDEIEEMCLICHESKKAFYKMSCEHRFCKECFRNFLRFELNEKGIAALKVKCPMEGCLVNCFEVFI